MATRTDAEDNYFGDANWRRNVRRAILTWFKKHARDLPWRQTRDPYKIWVSEIMLQQTQVATVETYFERFIEQFPDVRSLAEADEQKVLRLWEGLGYYRRARQLHRAAQVVVEQHGGKFPRDAAEVHNLPGIGRYTAGAVLSIAFDAQEPILEANTIRLFARLLKFPGDPLSSAGQKLLWQAAETLLPRKNTGQFNQSLMELGSLVCTPTNPDCDVCPLMCHCPTRMAGLQETIPQPKRKMQYESVTELAVVAWRDNKVLLRRCSPGQRWAGLWDFPRFASEQPDPKGSFSGTDAELINGVERQTGVTVEPFGHLTTIKHAVTKYRITLHCHNARFVRGSIARSRHDSLRWVDCDRLEELPLSTTGRKIGRLLTQ